MKIKFILLLPLILCLTGCFNYEELNDMTIISKIFIDKKDDIYNLVIKTFDKKEYIGNGSSLEEAFDSISNNLYFGHLKNLVISKNCDDIKEITNYFFNNPESIKKFYISLEEENKYLLFSDFLNNYYTEGKDPYLESKDEVLLFKGDKPVFLMNNIGVNIINNKVGDVYINGCHISNIKSTIDDKRIKVTGNNKSCLTDLKKILESTINTTKVVDSDIFGISYYYYKMHNKRIPYKDIDFELEVELYE